MVGAVSNYVNNNRRDQPGLHQLTTAGRTTPPTASPSSGRASRRSPHRSAGVVIEILVRSYLEFQDQIHLLLRCAGRVSITVVDRAGNTDMSLTDLGYVSLEHFGIKFLRGL